MKIVIVICDLASGGAERVASLWAKGFVTLGHEVTIILNNKSLPVVFSVPENVSLQNIYYSIGGKVLSNIFYPFRLFRLRNYLKNSRPNVIITVLHPMGLITKIASLGLNIPIINTEHNAFEKPAYIRFPWYSKLNKFYVNKLFEAVTVLTKADYRVIGNRLNNVYVMPNPVTYEICDTILLKKKIILAAGRLAVWHCKGFDVLIKAFAKMSDLYPDWELHIAGKGNEIYGKKLLESVPGYIKKRIKFLGQVDSMEKIYQEASIFVLSSRYEGFGMVLLEAMSQGCACVACDYKGRQNEILEDNKYGLLVMPDDIEELSLKMRCLIEDRELRLNYQKAALVRAREYSLPNIMKRWSKLLVEVSTPQNE